jgi:hypothetical protein
MLTAASTSFTPRNRWTLEGTHAYIGAQRIVTSAPFQIEVTWADMGHADKEPPLKKQGLDTHRGEH